ncbi:hypothetical protein AKJ56_02130 [candidate division MSBL1 archaeon SCGC-AAA382N08]|uniref:6-phosphogluconate dehydrogenase n=1 Tax=candidate division MSBL1 archaeon SCGC-AAA382N08 TaxID=1698285 RepID=A0A133VNA8_9EURY|nr:hypothetical protein AKJ56_02130 [candidate division MSBL1 archaeon SCGC-AAA382N08]
MEKIGFIGLGKMGNPMAMNIHDADFPLEVYNRTFEKTKPFRDKGVKAYKTAENLAKNSDVIIIMVTGPEDLLEVLKSDEGVLAGLKEDSVVINMSTVSPDATLEAAELVREKNANFVDSPVSGTVGPAEKGTLTILSAGKEEVLDRVKPILEKMGEPVVNCGEAGKGTEMKLFINLLLGGMMESLSESLVFGKKLGLDVSKMQKVMQSGGVDCLMFRVKSDLIKNRDFEPRFKVNLIHKDLSLALDSGGKLGVALPAAAAAREIYSGAKGMDLGKEDMTANIKVLEKIADITVED